MTGLERTTNKFVKNFSAAQPSQAFTKNRGKKKEEEKLVITPRMRANLSSFEPKVTFLSSFVGEHPSATDNQKPLAYSPQQKQTISELMESLRSTLKAMPPAISTVSKLVSSFIQEKRLQEEWKNIQPSIRID